MKITEIRVKLVDLAAGRGEKLKAFCSVTLDDEIVIRDLRIIEGARGLFVAMPSRKLMAKCHKCHTKNPVRARFCNECGSRQRRREESDDPQAGRRLYADVAHPIHARARDALQGSVIRAYEQEREASKRQGYVPPRFDDFDYDEDFSRRQNGEPRPPRERSADA